MAAKTPDSSTAGRELSKRYMGMRHEVYEFLGTNTISSSDTWELSSGSNAQIVHAAWEPAAATDAVSVTKTAGTSILFTASAGTKNGTLHLWLKG